MKDLFGEEITSSERVSVRIYADEIQDCTSPITGETWLYTGAIYEIISNPILEDLINVRYLKDKEGWNEWVEKNNSDTHWSDFRKEAKKRDVISRWLKYIYDDCFLEQKFHFSILGINLSNLNINEFDKDQTFNSIYNRFFRSMLLHSLKRFFGKGVTVEEILHERGPQENHPYFDWHTIYKLDQNESINLNRKPVEFLPKSHKDDQRSNAIQLIDVLLGIFKDLHLGTQSDYPEFKKQILDHPFVNELIIERIVKKPLNYNSSYGYSNRFNISLFPNKNTPINSIERLTNSYYDISKLQLHYLIQNQQSLF